MLAVGVAGWLLVAICIVIVGAILGIRLSKGKYPACAEMRPVRFAEDIVPRDNSIGSDVITTYGKVTSLGIRHVDAGPQGYWFGWRVWKRNTDIRSGLRSTLIIERGGLHPINYLAIADDRDVSSGGFAECHQFDLKSGPLEVLERHFGVHQFNLNPCALVGARGSNASVKGRSALPLALLHSSAGLLQSILHRPSKPIDISNDLVCLVCSTISSSYHFVERILHFSKLPIGRYDVEHRGHSDYRRTGHSQFIGERNFFPANNQALLFAHWTASIALCSLGVCLGLFVILATPRHSAILLIAAALIIALAIVEISHALDL